MPDNRSKPDLINLEEATADILEVAGVVENDRNIVSWDGSRIMGIDRDNPRVEIEIQEVQDVDFP
jgi:Holliday junction resolvase RusA-like endonuclease